jgi:hypothetical protein
MAHPSGERPPSRHATLTEPAANDRPTRKSSIREQIFAVALLLVPVIWLGWCTNFLVKWPTAAEKVIIAERSAENDAMVKAQNTLRARLSNPNAMAFRNVHVRRFGDTLLVCGEYVSDGGASGDAGYRPFASNGATVVTEGEAAVKGSPAGAILARCTPQ